MPPHIAKRVCDCCGKVYRPRAKNQRYCSRKCSNHMIAVRKKAKRMQERTGAGRDEHRAPAWQGAPKMRLPIEALKRFGFRRDPFADEPTEFTELFWSESHRKVRNQILAAVNAADGIAVSAPVGWGKTFLWYGIEDTFAHDDTRGYLVTRVQSLDKGLIKPNTILRAIYEDIEGPAPKQIESESFTRSVAKLLIDRARAQRKHIVLVVDEAHRLHDDAYRAFKNLLDVKAGIRRVIAVVLLGQEELGVTFRSHGTREVGARFSLIEPDPLSVLDDEVRKFIHWRCYIAAHDVPPSTVEQALASPNPFTPEAIDAVQQELGEGGARPDILPVQTVASWALLEAWQNAEDKVTDQHVRFARNKLLQGVF